MPTAHGTNSTTGTVSRRGRQRRRGVVSGGPDMSELRIIRGYSAPKGEFPFFVLADGCGGSLVHGDVVLTAKHCRSSFRWGSTVFVGAVVYQLPWARSGKSGAERRSTRASVVHPNLDLMVVGLKKPSTKPPVELNGNNSSPFDNQALTVLGFGKTKRKRHSSSLMEANVTHVPTWLCRKYQPGVDFDHELCASQRKRAVCYGDSGGPLLDARWGHRRTQLGVVLRGPDTCNHPTEPAVYARINASTRWWIRQKVCQITKTIPKPEYCNNKKNRRIR